MKRRKMKGESSRERESSQTLQPCLLCIVDYEVGDVVSLKLQLW